MRQSYWLFPETIQLLHLWLTWSRHTTKRPTCQTIQWPTFPEWILLFTGVLEFSHKSDILRRSILLIKEQDCIKQLKNYIFFVTWLPVVCLHRNLFFHLWEVKKGSFAKKKCETKRAFTSTHTNSVFLRAEKEQAALEIWN